MTVIDPTPDTDIKVATVLKEDLPAFSSNALGYFVRYRVVSKDKNRSSHWSPYYFLLKGVIQKVPCSVVTSGTSPKVLNLVWQHPKVDSESNEISVFKEYDIYLKTNLVNSWTYVASSPSTQFSTLLESGVSSFQVAVQVPVYPKTYSETAAIFTSAQTSV